MATTRQTINRFNKYVIGNYTRIPCVIVRGLGSEVWDADGKRYLDFFPGWAVSGVGHCHPKVVRAIQEQASRLLHIANNFYSQPQGDLARLVSKHSFGGKCFFCNSGAEANEGAIKLARLATSPKKYKFITFENSFHGRTLATIAATAQPKYQKGFEPMPEGFVYAPFNDLDAVKKLVDDETCAIMVEPVQGEGGINVGTPEFLQGLRDLCDKKKMILIFDEVQTGMGRLGDYFACKHYRIDPDIMTLAKSLGGGAAIGGLVARDAVAEKLVPGTHASTFGGNPLAAAAAIGVFEAIREDKLIANARKMGRILRKRLDGLCKKYPSLVKEVRGIGVMLGMELAFSGAGLVKRCMEKGLLVNCTHDTVLRVMPAITVNERQIDEAVAILDEALGEEDAS